MADATTGVAAVAKPNRTAQAWGFWREAQDRGRHDRNRPSVLVVDDDVATGRVHMERLLHEGYRATGASDPGLALSMAQQARPSIIFVHIGRGGSGSSAFIHTLRSSDATRHIPVILLTSYFNSAFEGLGLRLVAPHLV